MKIQPNHIEKIKLTLVDNSYFDSRSKIGNDIEVKIQQSFDIAYKDGLISEKLQSVQIIDRYSHDIDKIIVKLIPPELQRHLQINWVRI